MFIRRKALQGRLAEVVETEESLQVKLWIKVDRLGMLKTLKSFTKCRLQKGKDLRNHEREKVAKLGVEIVGQEEGVFILLPAC